MSNSIAYLGTASIPVAGSEQQELGLVVRGVDERAPLNDVDFFVLPNFSPLKW